MFGDGLIRAHRRSSKKLSPETGEFTGTLALCWHLAKRPLGPCLAIFGLGLLAAIFEGLVLLLFVPLVGALSGTAPGSNFVELQFARLLGAVSPSQAVAVSVVLLCLLVLAKNVAAFAGLWLTRRTEGMVAHDLRVRIFRQTLDSCIDYRPEVRRSDIVTTLTENSWKVAKVMALACRMAISAATIVLFGTFLALISLPLLLFSILFLGLGSIAIRLATRQAAAVGHDVVRENKAFGLHIWERVQALQLIRTFGREADESRTMERISERVRDRLLRLDLLWGTPGPLTESGILLLIGGLILMAERLDVGVASLAAFLTLLYRLQAPARELMEGRVAVEGMASSVADVGALIEESRAPFLADGTIEATSLRNGIRLDRVTFAYESGAAPVLDDVSLFIPAGRTTAIVGPSGAGKSTLLALLQRYFDAGEGEILVDGTPLDRLRLASWRGRLSLMSQDVQLFNESVRSNIAYALPGADEQAIRAAARVAHADEFIERLPDGYDTLIGDRGLRLSGGQRQRLALARTILRGSDVLLLDEPTNALDPDLEQAFQEALALHGNGRTLVVIAHRLNTIMRADQVIVLDRGRVVERGAPGDLLRASGRFEALYERQRAMGVPC